MSRVISINDQQWVGVRRAAELLSATPYSVQRLALEGYIRSRPHPPFKTLFSLTDIEGLARSFDRTAAAAASTRQVQLA